MARKHAPMTPLLDAFVAHHGIDRAAIEGRIEDDSTLVVRRRDGSLVSSGTELMKLAAGQRRWQATTIAAAATTDRERVVGELLARGDTTETIARQLGVSTRTVTSIRRVLRDKEATTIDAHTAPIDVGVIGPPGVLRDLVVDALTANGLVTTTTGRPDRVKGVIVFVAPTARDLTQRTTVRSVVVGAVPRSIGHTGAVRNGTIAILGVDTSVGALIDAVDAARLGRPAFDTATIQRLTDDLYGQGRRDHDLTERERAVLQSIADGDSVKQAARRLGVSPKTIEATRRTIYRKLGVRTAHEARLAHTSA